MHLKTNGYVAGAYLLHPLIQKMREHVELEKFICRVLKDDERTRQFKLNTQTHFDPIWALRYNSEAAINLTAEKRNSSSNADTK